MDKLNDPNTPDTSAPESGDSPARERQARDQEPGKPRQDPAPQGDGSGPGEGSRSR